MQTGCEKKTLMFSTKGEFSIEPWYGLVKIAPSVYNKILLISNKLAHFRKNFGQFSAKFCLFLVNLDTFVNTWGNFY